MEIKRVILGAFGYVYELRRPFSKALIAPMVLLFILYTVPLPVNGLSLVVLNNILELAICSILAITIHRIILLGPGSVSEWGISIPSRRELIFVIYSVGIAICLIPFGLLALIPVIGWVLAIFTMIYILGRLSLVFPAIATDRNWTFGDSWRATRDHQVLMMVVAAIFPLIISIPERLLSYVPYMNYLVSLLSVITIVFVVAALSVAYQVIAQERK